MTINRDMCTGYTIASSSEAIEREFQAEFQFTYEKRYHTHGGLALPVICGGEETKIVAFRWGLVPHWSKKPLSYHIINTDARDIVRDPVGKVLVRRRRCLTPFNCFFIRVRQNDGRKVPYVVYDGKQRIMSFASIWDVWQSHDKSTIIHSFSIITTRACKRLERFTRTMPVIIPPSRRRRYLDATAHLNRIMPMLRPYENDSLNLYPVTDLLNDFSINSRDILLPAGERVYKEYTYEQKVYLKLEGMGSMKDNPDRKPEIRLML